MDFALCDGLRGAEAGWRRPTISAFLNFSAGLRRAEETGFSGEASPRRWIRGGKLLDGGGGKRGSDVELEKFWGAVQLLEEQRARTARAAAPDGKASCEHKQALPSLEHDRFSFLCTVCR